MTGIEGARSAGLITQLNQSQTIDGITVKLNYAYADGSRILVNYSVSAVDAQGITRPVSADVLNKIQYRLRDSGNLMLIENIMPDYQTDYTYNQTMNTVSFNLPAGIPLPEQLDLNLEMVLSDKPGLIKDIWSPGQRLGEFIQVTKDLNIFTLTNHIPQTTLSILRIFYVWLTPVPGRITSGITSFSPVQLTLNPEYTAEPAPLVTPNGGVGPFTFQISGVNTFWEVIVHPEQTVTLGEDTLTFEQLRITPTKIEVSLCLQANPSKNWTIGNDIQLTVGDQISNLWGFNSRFEGRPCYDLIFDVFTEQLPPSITLSVSDFFVPFFSEVGQELIDRFDDPKIIARSADGQTWSYDLDNPQLRAALIEMGYLADHEGDWKFIVDLTQ
jgi:hypothetical protein